PLPLSRLDAKDADAQLMRKVGIIAPWSPPVLGEVMAGGAAERFGLHKGDTVLRVGGKEVGDAQQLRDLIRAQVQGGRGIAAPWDIERAGQRLQVQVTPDVVAGTGGAPAVGRISAHVGV